jgi:hypothetical protein
MNIHILQQIEEQCTREDERLLRRIEIIDNLSRALQTKGVLSNGDEYAEPLSRPRQKPIKK